MVGKSRNLALVAGAPSGTRKEFAKWLIADSFQVYEAASHVEKMDDLAKRGSIPFCMGISKKEDIRAADATLTRGASRRR